MIWASCSVAERWSCEQWEAERWWRPSWRRNRGWRPEGSPSTWAAASQTRNSVGWPNLPGFGRPPPGGMVAGNLFQEHSANSLRIRNNSSYYASMSMEFAIFRYSLFMKMKALKCLSMKWKFLENNLSQLFVILKYVHIKSPDFPHHKQSNFRSHLQWRGHGWVWVGSNPPTFKKAPMRFLQIQRLFLGGGGVGLREKKHELCQIVLNKQQHLYTVLL